MKSGAFWSSLLPTLCKGEDSVGTGPGILLGSIPCAVIMLLLLAGEPFHSPEPGGCLCSLKALSYLVKLSSESFRISRDLPQALSEAQALFPVNPPCPCVDHRDSSSRITFLHSKAVQTPWFPYLLKRPCMGALNESASYSLVRRKCVSLMINRKS